MTRWRRAVLVFLGVEAWVLVLYAVGIRATIAGMDLASLSLLVAGIAAAITATFSRPSS